MTETDFIQLKQRIAKGKAWIERLKYEGRYWAPDTREHIQLWMDMVWLYIDESNRRVGDAPEETHSQAWRDLKAKEKENEQRREAARIKREWNAERKRQGLN